VREDRDNSGIAKIPMKRRGLRHQSNLVHRKLKLLHLSICMVLLIIDSNILPLVPTSRIKRNREEDTVTVTVTVTDNANANNVMVAQLVEQNNSLTTEKNHLERIVKSLQFEKEMRDVDELNAALLNRERELANNRTLLDRIKELESKNHHLNHKVMKLEKDNTLFDGKVGGLKALLGHRNDTIVGLLELNP